MELLKVFGDGLRTIFGGKGKEEPYEAYKTAARSPSISMSGRLYVILRHPYPIPLFRETFNCQVTTNDRSNKLPVSLILTLLCPLIREDSNADAWKQVTSSITALTDFIQDEQNWDAAIFPTYFSRLSWILQTLNGAIEELMLIINDEIDTKTNPLPGKPLTVLPKFARNYGGHIKAIASEACSRFSTATDLFLWLCIANAALSSKTGSLQHQLLSGAQQPKNNFPQKGTAEGVKKTLFFMHFYSLICHRVKDDALWEKEAISLPTSLMKGLSDKKEALDVKRLLYNTLSNTKNDDSFTRVLGQQDWAEFIAELAKFINPFLSSRIEGPKLGLFQYENWWSLLSQEAPRGSALKALIDNDPTIQHSWARYLGPPLVAEIFSTIHLKEAESAERLAAVFHPITFTVESAGEIKSALQAVFRGGKQGGFLKLLSYDVVIKALESNKSALDYIGSAIVTLTLNKDQSTILVENAPLCRLLPVTVLPQLIEAAAGRVSCPELMSVIHRSQWLDVASREFEIPRINNCTMPPDDDGLLYFIRFDFSPARFPIVFWEGNKPRMCSASWVWLAGLKSMHQDTARMVLRNERLLNEIHEIAASSMKEGKSDNVLKIALLIDTLLQHARRIGQKISKDTTDLLLTVLFDLLEYLEADEGSSVYRLLGSDIFYRQLLPYHLECKENTHELKLKAGQEVTILGVRLPKFVAESSLKLVDEFIARCLGKGGDTREGKAALYKISSACNEAHRATADIQRTQAKYLLLLDWLTKARRNAHAHCQALGNNGSGIVRSISESLTSAEALKRKLDDANSLSNLAALQKALEDLQSSLYDGSSGEEIAQLDLLLFDPIRSNQPESALFIGFFYQWAQRCDTVAEALRAALGTFEEYTQDPFQADDKGRYQFVAKILVTEELDFISSWARLRRLRDIEMDRIRDTLEAIQISEKVGVARRLLEVEGLSKGDWDPKELTSKVVQKILKQVPEEVLQSWRAVISVPSFVGVMNDVFAVTSLKVGPDPTEAEIVEHIILSLKNQIDGIIDRMRGLGSDASYDVLVAFRHFVPFVAALVLTGSNKEFTLDRRLKFLTKFEVSPLATHNDTIRMLNENIGDVVRIIEVEGSTTETGRIKTELALVQKDRQAMIAVCVGVASTTSLYHNISVRLIRTNPKDKTELVVSRADDELATFEERVVMIESNEKVASFSKAWRLACELLPLVAEAEWFGLKDGMIDLHRKQSEALHALPGSRNQEFYIYCIPVNDVVKETADDHAAFQFDLRQKLEEFIRSRKHELASKQWLLALPRRIAIDIITYQAPYADYLQAEIEHSLNSLGINATGLDDDTKIGLALTKASHLHRTSRQKIERRLDLLWYTNDHGKGSQQAALVPIYFGEAIRVAMSRHSWHPLPFELFWCSVQTSVHDVKRLIETMGYYNGCRYTVIGIEALTPAASQELIRGIMRLASQSEAPDLLILTGSDEIAFGDLQLELSKSVVLNKCRDEAPLKIPDIPDNLESLEKYRQNCTFVTGDFLSGKSHFAKHQEGIVALPHTGDALDIGMTLKFFQSVELQPHKAVWIDINSYMITPTPKDPFKLLRINYLLWQMLQNRLIIDDASGEATPIPHNIKIVVEVPSSDMRDPTTPIASAAHLGRIRQVSSNFSDFEITDQFAKVAAGLGLMVAADRLCSSHNNRETWTWEKASLFGVDISQRAAAARQILVKCWRARILPMSLIAASEGNSAEIQLRGPIGDIKLARNGRLASLLQILYHRFDPILSSKNSHLSNLMSIDYASGFLSAMELIVGQVCERWVQDCAITSERLATKPIFLPTTSSFVTYPLNVGHGSEAVEKLCNGSVISRTETLSGLRTDYSKIVAELEGKRDPNDSDKELLRKARPLARLSSNEVDLSYVLTGDANRPDMLDLHKAFDAVGFVTVDDMLIRALHCVERQQSMSSLIIEGGTGVGKSFLLSMMFRIQMQYALRMAKHIVTDFLWEELLEFEMKRDLAGLQNDLVINGFTQPPKIQGFPTPRWFTQATDGEALLERTFKTTDVLQIIAPIFTADTDAGEFYKRFDAMMAKLDNYPVLVAPALPDCMRTSDEKGQPKPRTLEQATMTRFFELLATSHVDHEYKIVAHPDTKRDDIIRLLEKPMALAMALRNSIDSRVNQLVVPVLIDECNTLVETAGLAKTIMCDKRNPLTGESLADAGIWFVGAINKKSEHYRTQALHPSLEPSVSHFEGVSGESQQRSYIEQTLVRCADFLTERRFLALKDQLIKIMLGMHRMSEDLSRPRGDKPAMTTHLVSQREYHKVDAIIKTIYHLLGDEVKNNNDKVQERDLLLACSCLTAVYYVYVARIREPELRAAAKEYMERFCAAGELRNVYFAENRGFVVDTARAAIISKIVTKTNFNLDPGVALTDTLKENVFLTLLACTSHEKHKICLAIIGDSGMGKTLSSRVVERNMRGGSSATELCKRLPHARFFYIQGATTTTSEQVSRVCERAQKDQERGQSGAKSIVSFDEASLPKSERRVHKSLHEPVDRKIISIVVLSNKPFDDEANQNRFLVVWNESLEVEEVQELTSGCLEYNYSRDDSDENPFRPIVLALAKSYFDLRKEGSTKLEGRNPAAALQMRDYVYLLKFLAVACDGKEGKIFGPRELKQGIEINYGTSANGFLSHVLSIFFKNMKDAHAHVDSEWARCSKVAPMPIEQILQASYGRYRSDQTPRIRPRFKILIDPTETYCVANAAIAGIQRIAKEHNPTQNVVHITVNELEGDRRRSFEAKILSKLRIAMEVGDHVVIRNPERLLSYLFDVLNLNYTTYTNTNDDTTTERAIVALGAETDLFDINKLFLITFVFSAATIEKLESSNVPFLSRCEKYLLRVDYDDVFRPVANFAEEWVGKHNIYMYHPQLTVASAVVSTAEEGYRPGSPLDPNHVFRANCQILSLVPPQFFLRMHSKLTRGSEYVKAYLAQHHFSLDALITSAKPGTCTMACTTDTVSLKSEATGENRGRLIVDVESFDSFEELTGYLQECNRREDGRPIVLVVTSQRSRHADFMWTLCNLAGELSGTANAPTHKGARSRHPLLIVSSAPCKVTAVFSEHWRFVFLDSCSTSLVAHKLLQSYVANSDGDEDAEVSTEEVGEQVILDVLRAFVSTHQPVPYSAYSQIKMPLEAMVKCAKIDPIRSHLLRSLADGLLPSKVSKLVQKCLEESSGQVVNQPFMAVLHLKSKAAFLEGARPFLRLVAGSALIDGRIRGQYKGNSPKSGQLKSCIEAYLAYCADNLPAEEGKPRIYILNHPENGAYRHPLSSWIFPIVWHRVMNLEVKSQEPQSPLSPSKADKRTKEVIEQCVEGSPAHLNVLALTEAERSDILLDVLQQCGLLPAMTRNLKEEQTIHYEQAVLKAVTEMHVDLCGASNNGGMFVQQLYFAAITVVGGESGRLRQFLMTNVFLRFLEASGVSVAKDLSQATIAQVVANSIIKSFKEPAQGDTSVGLSLLFSFLFRTQSAASQGASGLGKTGLQAVLAMLTELDSHLLTGPTSAAKRAKLVTGVEPPNQLTLEYLDQYAKHCGMAAPSISALTWYMSSLVDLSKQLEGRQDVVPRILADLKYAVANHNRPLLWPIISLLLETAMELAAPLEHIEAVNPNLKQKEVKESALEETIKICSAIVSVILHADGRHTLPNFLVDFATVGDVQPPGLRIRQLLAHTFSSRIERLLKSRKLGDSMRRIGIQYEGNPPAFVKHCLVCAACSLMASDDNPAAEIQRLTETRALPFFFQEPAPGKVNDPFGMYLLLAYFERAKTMDGVKALIAIGGALQPPIKVFQDWGSHANAANRVTIYTCVPAAVRSSAPYKEIKRIAAEGGSLAGKDMRLVMHAIREEVFLTQCIDAQAATVKRQNYTASLRGAAQPDPLVAKVIDLLLKPLTAIAQGNRMLEGLLGATNANTTMPALISFIMIEISVRGAAALYWYILMTNPAILKGKSAFGDFSGSQALGHGFDCGAQYDEATGAKLTPYASMALPDQYSLLALMYAGVLSFCLLFPESATTTVETVMTNYLIGSIPPAACAGNLRPTYTAATACSQHLRFLETVGYNNQTLILHLMKTFTASVDSPPPIHCQGFPDADRYHRLFANLVANAQAVRNEVAETNRELASCEWEVNVLELNARLPSVDIPHQRPNNNLGEAKKLLVEFSHVLETTQTAPRIARLYSTLNEESTKLKFLKQFTPESVTFAQMKVNKGSKLIADGQQAFNHLLKINNGRLAIECHNDEVPKIEDQSSVFTYVTRDKANRINDAETDTQLDGLLLHALTAIANKVPSIATLEEKIKGNTDLAKRIFILGEKDLVRQSASLWATYNPSSTKSEGIRDAAMKVLTHFCEDQSDAMALPLQAAIANFFVLPSMQLQIDKGSIKAPFSFPREPVDNTEHRIHDLEAEVRTMAVAKAVEFDIVYGKTEWPFQTEVPSRKDFLDKLNAALADNSIRLEFLQGLRELFAAPNQKPPSEVQDWPQGVSTVISECLPEVSAIAFGARNAVFKITHLPPIIVTMFVAADPYLEAAGRDLFPSFCENLSAAAAQEMRNMLTDKKSRFGALAVADRIELVDGLKGMIVAVCGRTADNKASTYPPSTALFSVATEYDDEEITALIPIIEPPILLRSAAGVLALIDQVKADVYQLEHERKTVDRQYQLDVAIGDRVPDPATIDADFEEINNGDDDEQPNDPYAPTNDDYYGDDGRDTEVMEDYSGINLDVTMTTSTEAPSSEDKVVEVGSNMVAESATMPPDAAVTQEEAPPNDNAQSSEADQWADTFVPCLQPLLSGYKRPSMTYTAYVYTSPQTPIINEFLEQGTIRPPNPPAGGVVIAPLVPTAVDGKYSLGPAITHTTIDKNTPMPKDGLVFEEMGRVITSASLLKGLRVVYSSTSFQSHSFEFVIQNDKPAKFPVLSVLSLGAATAIIESKLKGTTLVPYNQLPLSPSTPITALTRYQYQKAPCPNPVVVISGKGGDDAFELLSPSAYITGTPIRSEMVAAMLSGSSLKAIPGNNGQVLHTRRAVAAGQGKLTYAYRSSVIDLAEGTTIPASVATSRPSLTRDELVAELVRTKSLRQEEAASCTVTDPVTGRLISSIEALTSNSRTTVYVQGDHPITVEIVVNRERFPFLLDAKLSHVIAIVRDRVPHTSLWWEGINVSDSVFCDLRLGQLCMAKGTWIPPAMSTMLGALRSDNLAEEESADDFFKPEEDEEEVAEFFGVEDEDDDVFASSDDDEGESKREVAAEIITSNRGAPNYEVPKVAALSLTFIAIEPSALLANISMQLPNHDFEFQVSNQSDETLLLLLSLTMAIPRELIAPAMQAGEVAEAGLIIVNRTPEADETDPRIEVIASPAFKYSITLYEHFSIDGPTAERLSLSVSLFRPSSCPVIRLSDGAVAGQIHCILSNSETTHFDTKELESDAAEATCESFIQVLMSAVAAANIGLSLLQPVPFASGCVEGAHDVEAE